MISEVLRELLDAVKDRWSDEELDLVKTVGEDYANLMAAQLIGDEVDEEQIKIVKATLGNLGSAARAEAENLLNVAIGKVLDSLMQRFKI